MPDTPLDGSRVMFGRMYLAGQPLMICGECGALVHPMQEDDHREFHGGGESDREATDA